MNRTITVPRSAQRLLCGVVFTTSNRRRAARSRFSYRPLPGGRYGLTPLGILHGLTGLSLTIKERR